MKKPTKTTQKALGIVGAAVLFTAGGCATVNIDAPTASEVLKQEASEAAEGDDSWQQPQACLPVPGFIGVNRGGSLRARVASARADLRWA